MSELGEQVFERVAGLTGRDRDELFGDMNLANDLGFDSLKIMSLWQAVFALLPPGVSGDLKDFAQVVTLDDLVAAVESLATAGASGPVLEAYVSASDPGGRAIPMAMAQQFFLISHQLTGSTSLCSTVEVAGRIDPVRLQAAWQKLVARHVNLRTCFHIPPSATQLAEIEYRLLEDVKVPALRRIDLTQEVDAATAWDALFHEQLNRKWDLRTWPLHEVICVSLPDGRDAVMIANEHIISDGLGNQRLLGDLLALYEGAGSGLAPVLDDAGYVAAIEAMNAWQDDEAEADFAAAEAGMKGLRSLWDPNTAIASLPKEPRFRNRRIGLGREMTAQLQQLAARQGVTLYPLLLASLNALFRDRLGLEDDKASLMQVPTAGTLYPGVELGATVGCFAQNLSLRLTGTGQGADGMLASARSIGAALRDTLVSGHDRVQTRMMARAMQADFPIQQGRIPSYVLDQARQSLRANFYAPFTGETGLPARLSGMALSGYRAATKNVAGTIDVLHELHDGELIAFVNHDADCFTEAQIDALCAEHLATLKLLCAPVTPAAKTLAPAKPVIVDDLLSAIVKECAVMLNRDAGAIDPAADLGAMGVDSLGRIRLVQKIAADHGGRKLARKLIDCRTLADMAACIATETAPVVTKAVVPVPPAKRSAPCFDTDIAPIPLRHIEAQAQMTPKALAVTDGIVSLTYGELDMAANRLAHTLAAEGVCYGDRVAVTCRRGPDMLVAILGILKLGAAYVPLDPDFPADRMAYITGHAECRVWVGHLDMIARNFRDQALPEGVACLVSLDDETRADFGELRCIARSDWSGDTSQPETSISADDIMVLLYTSGSTGKPKGVICHHRGYMNRLEWHQSQFRLQPGERVALKTSFSFDVSVWELFWPLMTGGTICAADRELVSNPWRLADWLAEQRIAVMHFVPSLFNEFVNAVCDERLELPAMRWLVFSGEALGVKPVQAWMATQAPHIRLANLYGPTEASIDVTCEVIEAVPPASATRISIGRPILNTVMLILDDKDQPVTGTEAQGELCIAGVQVAGGYYRDAERTAKSFVPNHLADRAVPGKCIYRTGDLARWHADGRIDYLGRKDSQIKLRGFRIELGEIEAVAANHPDVAEAGVRLVRGEDGAQDRLVLWYAPETADRAALRDWVARHVAAYAVPDLLVPMAVLPKNHNGKLDRNALELPGAAVDMVPSAAAAASLPPAAQAGLRAVAEFTTLPQTAPDRRAAPSQRALLREHAALHCGASLLMLEYHDRLNIDAFTDAVNSVIARHPALRATFYKQGGQWLRHTEDRGRFTPQLFAAESLPEEDFLPEFQRVAKETALAVDPGTWPLVKVLVARRAADRFAVAIVGSALVGDMVGAFAFGRAIWQAYLGNAGDDTAPVPDSADLMERAGALLSPDRDGLAGWWRNHLGETPDGTMLPMDWPHGENLHGSETLCEAALSRDETMRLSDRIAAHPALGLFDLVAAATYRHAGEAVGQGSATISHRVNGRNVLTDRLYFDGIDCFAYNFPLRLDLRPGESLLQTARRFQGQMQAAPLKGYSYTWLGDRLPARHWPVSAVTDLRLNFLGEARTPQNSAVRFISSGNSARIAPDHSLRGCGVEIVGQLAEGRLVLKALYSANQYRPESIDRFLAALKAELLGAAQPDNMDLTNAA